MSWMIGIDEAGYGPNLGPFVMAATTFRIPEESRGQCLWKKFNSAVRRAGEERDKRILIEDSKEVYSTARGLGDLELGVLTAIRPEAKGIDHSLKGLIKRVCNGSAIALAEESWYHGTTPLPVAVEGEHLAVTRGLFRECCRQTGIELASIQAAVICPAEFNKLIDCHGTKGAVLGHALAALLPSQIRQCGDGAPIDCFIDKHGGRNAYAALLQNVLPESFIVAKEEHLLRSRYRACGGGHELTITFQPRADAEFFAVALASMVSKYLRELFMREFNDYWLARIPGLKPTAGYPGDAERFFKAIQPIFGDLGLCETSVWRRR